MMTLDKDGTLEAVALTDGTATITNGAISSVNTLTATTLTDGTASITGGKYTTTVVATGGGMKTITTARKVVRHWITEALRLPAGASGRRPGRELGGIPTVAGYNGHAQRMQYSGHKRCHGNNHQGIETPDGIIVEMHGPFEGRANDKRMMRESQLLERMAASFPGYLWLRGASN